jgi:hypothetical protein
VKEAATTTNERVSTTFGEGRKGCVDFFVAAGIKNNEF